MENCNNDMIKQENSAGQRKLVKPPFDIRPKSIAQSTNEERKTEACQNPEGTTNEESAFGIESAESCQGQAEVMEDAADNSSPTNLTEEVFQIENYNDNGIAQGNMADRRDVIPAPFYINVSSDDDAQVDEDCSGQEDSAHTECENEIPTNTDTPMPTANTDHENSATVPHQSNCHRPATSAQAHSVEFSNNYTSLTSYRFGQSLEIPEYFRWIFSNYGPSEKDRQRLDYELASNIISLDYRYRMGMMSLGFQEEKYRLKQAYQEQKVNCQKASMLSIEEGGNGILPQNKFDLRDVEKDFISDFGVVKTCNLKKGGFVTWIWSPLYWHHVAIDEAGLRQEYFAWLDEVLPDGIEYSQAAMERSYQRMRRSILRLEISGLSVLKATQAMFRNGIYDAKENQFRSLPPMELKRYFSLFCFDIDFNIEAPNPDCFDELLQDALSSPEAITLFYEQVGSILLPIPTHKKLIVYQGVPQAGKTRLSNIIIQLMPSGDTKVLDSLSDITDKNLSDVTNPIRLAYVKELGKNKIPARQIVSLKGFADGSSLPNVPSFKILLNTNYAICTGENGEIENALRVRLSVLPFPKPMSNAMPCVAAYEDCHFEQERSAIIVKALRAYSHVLRNGNSFSFDFEINRCLDCSATQSTTMDQIQELLERANGQLQTMSQNTLKYVLDKLFVLGDTTNPEMTVSRIIEAVNQVLPNELRSEASAGTKLRECYGSNLKSSRNGSNGKTCYNLYPRPLTVDEDKQ